MDSSYCLLDSGKGRKLERFGPYVLDRPSAQAVWKPQLSPEDWNKADLFFTREGEYTWKKKGQVPESWTIDVSGIKFKISPTDFGHLGIFPEQRPFWKWIQNNVKSHHKVLNLFAYSGGSTLAAAKAGAQVCHLDASKGMVSWARENAGLNHLEGAPVRWIVDDVTKFLKGKSVEKAAMTALFLIPQVLAEEQWAKLLKLRMILIIFLLAVELCLQKSPFLFYFHVIPLVIRQL